MATKLSHALMISGVLLVASTAVAADRELVVPRIAGCFHPASHYIDGTLSESYDVDAHTRAVDGLVRYRQPNDKVKRMPFVIQYRDMGGRRMWRVIPDEGEDTGDAAPSPTCALRNWHAR